MYPIKTTSTIKRSIYAYTLPTVPDHDGYIKIGDTVRESQQRIKEQLGTAGIVHDILWTKLARKNDGTWFRDYDLHRFLLLNRIEKNDFGTSANEWFFFNGTPEKADELTEKFIVSDYKEVQIGYNTDYVLRKEQEDAVKKALEYFKNNTNGEFLWNAKPRFGKTLTTYDLARKLNAKKILIVTNRPAIANSWFDDFSKFIAWQTDYVFLSENPSLAGKALNRKEYVGIGSQTITLDKYDNVVNTNSEKTVSHSGKPFIEFESLQDLKGSKYFGGDFDKLKWIAQLEWDLLVIDEAHEGIDTFKTDMAFENIKRKNTLHLSGTPFKQIANEKFTAEQIFNWSYVDEQNAKENWNYSTGSNPYENLPSMCMFSYQLSEMIREKAEAGIEINGNNYDFCFDLNEFFRVDNENFVHENDVLKFLSNLTKGEKFPFSTEEYQNELKHTFWLLPGVAACKALEKILKNHSFFKDYNVVIAAGDGRSFESEEDDFIGNQKSFDRVKKTIHENDKTITLSCGQLTMGVTIPEWSAVFMLSNIKSPALYMQAAFRAQNPYEYTYGDNIIRKEKCYVFDFAPDRTLEIFDQFANNLQACAISSDEIRKENIKKLLNFFPVIAEDEEGKMIELDTEQVLLFPQKIKVREVVKSGFMNNFLFANIDRIFSAPKFVVDILNQLPEEKNKRANKSGENIKINAYHKDEQGNPTADQTKVISTTKDLFGDKIYAVENIADVIKEVKTFVEKEITPVISENKLVNTKEQSKRIGNKLLEKIADKKDEIEEIQKSDISENEKKQQVQKLVNEIIQETVKQTIETKEIKNETAKKNETESDVRDHLRGFSRTIPSFLMAYGNTETTLANFEEKIDNKTFEKLTSITMEQFQFLRDGGNYKDENGETKYFEGGLFNEIIFNASIQEFLEIKQRLSNYFQNEKEDIFDYIPPQETNQIFTPKRVVKMMVDSLQKEHPEIFESSETTFADLYMKSGLFIAEVVRRLFENTRRKYPSDRDCIRHILEKQVYGFAPTDILYNICLNLIFGFDTNNINKNNFFNIDTVPYCKNQNLETLLKENNMKFDVIIGNPPYQLEDGGAQMSAVPIYHKFILQAKKLNPQYLSMIVPARWYSGGKGLDEFRDDMLKDKRLKFLHDFHETSDVFSGLNIRGGVCYFLWEKDYNGDCEVINHNKGEITTATRPLLEKSANAFVRYNQAMSILKKVQKHKEKSFETLVSSRKAFGLSTDVRGGNKPFDGSIKLYQNGGIGYIKKEEVVKNKQWIKDWKVVIPYSSPGDDSFPHLILSKPIVAEPNSACTETYLVIGPFSNEKNCANVSVYLRSQFVRFLILLLKPTQHVTAKTYSFVPLQDFNEEWIDEKLYKKYGLEPQEVAFIESMIRPME